MLAIPVDIVFLFAVLPKCRSCPCFFSGVVSLTLRKRGHRKIISHSDGHSVVIGKTKKPIHRDIKNRREHCSRFKMMFYVSALKFKDGTVCSSVHSLTVPKHKVRTATFSLSISQALGGFATSQSYIVFSCRSFEAFLLYTVEHMFVNVFGDGFEYFFFSQS